MQLVKTHINILLPLTIIFAMGMRLMPELTFFYYPTPILLGLFILAGYKKILENKPLKILTIMLILFGAWAMITALWSDHPLFSLLRGGYFLLLALGAACGITLWSDTKAFRENPFGFLLPANLLILGTSLISLIFDWPADAWTGGNEHGFMGIFGLQLSLGMALLTTFLAPFYLFLKSIESIKTKSKKEITHLLFYILILVSNILILLLSHSRAALLSLAVGIFLSFFFFFNIRQKIYFAGGIVLIVVIIFTVPSLSTKFEKYTLKGTGHTTANRDILWGPSYEAAKIGGLFGIGYGTSTTEIETQFQIVDDAGRLRREKGNGILALIEEVGLIGLILFFAPIIYAFIMFFKKWQSKSLVLIVNCSLLIALILHSQFEAWFVGVGGFSLLIFLTIISLNPFIMSSIRTRESHSDRTNQTNGSRLKEIH